ncbi:hypothetical protein DFH09DRAFT_1355989 [Mycena vulgaris]|nr:hypothetical protein DFH09DRAFT_1355989 [Mycena vulgaris]
MHTLPVALFIWAISHFGSVHGYVPREDSPGGSPTKTAVSAIVTSLFSFDKISEMTTCIPATITWRYTPAISDDFSDFSDLTLSITNDVAQPSPPPSTTIGSFSSFFSVEARAVYRNRRDVLTQDISNGFIDPLALSYIWPSVNVSAGWYALEASISGTTVAESLSFYVINGSDTSCVGPVSPSSSSSTPNPTSSGTPTSSGGSASTSGITLPVNAATTKVNRGAIAGGVIGGLAILAAVVAAYFYLRYASASGVSGASPGRRGTRKWGGLDSTDSKARAYPSTSRNIGGSGHHSQSDSVGPMLSHDSSVYVIGNVGIDSRPSRIQHGLEEEEDEVNSYFSPSQEKFSSPTYGSPPIKSPFSDSGHIENDAMPLDIISPLPGNSVTRNSSTSTSSYLNNFSRPRSHPSSPYSGSPTSPVAEAPFSNSAANNTTSSLNHPESSYPPSPSPAFPSGTSQTATESPVPRRGSAGEPLATGSRRTPRKPVPQYNPTDPALTSASPPPPLAAHDSASSSREGSLRSGRSGSGAHDWPQLSHKASFGTEGRPVHYLIPDMPPPQRD